MTNTVVLLDLENNMPSAQLLRDIIQHHAVIYLFNCQGTFEYSLEDLTELSSWLSSGQVVVLETAEVEQKEFEYAVLVGQLLALLDDDAVVKIMSAMPSSEILWEMMQSSDINCSLLRLQAPNAVVTSKYKIPTIETIQQTPQLGLVKKYCDALAHMKGKPNSTEMLKNSLSNILQVDAEQARRLFGLLIKLKIVKSNEQQIHFRKKLLKQWIGLDLEQPTSFKTSADLAQLKSDSTSDSELKQLATGQNAQKTLFKNFAEIDPIQIIVARKLRELKQHKPKDIYALRDLLEQLFPKSDVRLLLKGLIEKGYIYWDGSEVLYSHEMFLN